jgi:mono/diheme cytochrome c family protein
MCSPKQQLLFVLLALFGASGCHPQAKDWRTIGTAAPTSWKTKTISPEPQVFTGNAEAGWQYLIYGDYLGAGVPVEMMGKRMPTYSAAAMPRTGDNASVAHDFTIFKAANGVKVINGNCLACHGGWLDGKVVPGLGNTQTQFQTSLRLPSKIISRIAKKRYPEGTPERAALANFVDHYRNIASYVHTNNPGVAPAFRLEEACTMHRNPQDLSYKTTPNYPMMAYTLASDVPPLWNIDRKNALYYNAMGKGDFRKLLLQAVVLATPDSSTARQALGHFTDVLAWAKQLQPPPYPFSIQKDLVAKGQQVFEQHCKGCHGRYSGDSTFYPNKVVALHVVKTDPLYAVYLAQHAGLADWYNKSWFARSVPQSRMEPEYGYIAPPLDGIWATAPYLHNGSVPTLEDLLLSTQRPTYWRKRNPDLQRGYDPQKAGWQYDRTKKAGKKDIFNTTKPGYSQQGHAFGDKLTAEERKALIEYLKTL